MKKDYMVIDLETTGLDPKKEAVTEVAFAIVDAETFEIKQAYTNLVKVDREISEFITGLTGITNEMCARDGVPVDVVAKDVEEALKGRIFVAQRVSFDSGFVEECLGVKVNRDEMLDTKALAAELEPGLSTHLKDICERHNFNLVGAHRALNDVFATVEVLQYYMGIKNKQK